MAATRRLGLTLDQVRKGIETFPGLAHRMEPIGTHVRVEPGRFATADGREARKAELRKRGLI